LFPAPCPFQFGIGKCRHDIIDQSPIRPSTTPARPNPQSSAALSSHQLAQNHPPPTPLPDQFPIDGQLLAAVPRVPSSEAFGRRPSALARVDCSRRAGIRNPYRKRSLTRQEHQTRRGPSGCAHRLGRTIVAKRALTMWRKNVPPSCWEALVPGGADHRTLRSIVLASPVLSAILRDWPVIGLPDISRPFGYAGPTAGRRELRSRSDSDISGPRAPSELPSWMIFSVGAI
jgi:hypothetical protein